MTRLTLATIVVLSLSACGSQTDAMDPAAPQTTATKSPLSFDVSVGDTKGFLATSTLIMGEKDAVLIDSQFNLANGRRLATWIKGKGKRLTAIYITHAHPDHYFAIEAVLRRFPSTPVYARPDVVEHMRVLGPKKAAYWGAIYKDDLTKQPIVATPLDDKHIELEGHKILVVDMPQGDASPTTIVHVPSLGLVVAGDMTFQGVHPWLADAASAEQRLQWLAGLQTLSELDPRHVVAGHRATAFSANETGAIDETIAYLKDFHRLRAQSKDAKSLEAAMTTLYPRKALPIILQLAAQAAFAQAPSQ